MSQPKRAPHDSEAETMKLPPDPHGPALPLVLGDRYRLVARLGGGGMANVYRAIDTHLDRNVAVKLMTPKLRADPEFDARFRREAQIVSKLNDPHIVVVHDFGLDAEHGPYLVMELLEGETLRCRLNAQGPLALPAALQLGEQLMLALAHAHGQGVIHRDLKPDNVFLLAQSGVKLHVRVLDFGIARMVGDGMDPADATRPGSTIGTPRYMAPEQHAGKGSSEQSDLYSAALVLYESLTGRLPDVTGPRLAEYRKDLPESLVHLVEQCLSEQPDERPLTAAEAYLQLHELVRDQGSDLLISDTAVAQLTARFRKKRLDEAEARANAGPTRRLWIGGVVATALMAAPVVWSLLPRPHPRPERDSVAGLSVGDNRDDAVSRLGKPTKADDPASVLEPFITLADLTDPADKQSPEILTWPARGVTAVLVGPEIRAVIARKSPAATGRDLRIGDAESEWRRAYSEPPSSLTLLPEGSRYGGWGIVYHYADSGLAIEIRGGRVSGLAMVRRRP
jgi:serine/threonine protein kinase